MNHDLFPLPESAPSALDVARRRLADAQEQHDFASTMKSIYGEATPEHVELELRLAKSDLARLERAEVERRRL